MSHDDEVASPQAQKELKKTVRNVIRKDVRARRAFDAMQQRGLSKADAEAEVARALLGCMFEAWNKMPDRWEDVLKALGEGRTAEELFPDALYEDTPNKSS